MISRRTLLLSALGTSALAIAPARILAAQSPAAGAQVDPELASYLALTPASLATLESVAAFTYGNAKLQADTLGFALPYDPANEEAQRAWTNGTFTVALPSAFRNYGFMDGFAELTGFEIGQVFSGAEMGEPPDVLTMIRGAFDMDAVRAAQRAAGYQETEIDGHPVSVLAGDYEISPDNPIQRWALARLNYSAVLDDGTLVYAPARALMSTALAPASTLDANPLVQQAMGALDASLITGALLGPGAFLPELPLAQLLEQPQTEDEVADFILAMQDKTPAPMVLTGIVGSTPGGPVPTRDGEATPPPAGEPTSLTKMALVYLSPEEAATAAEQIDHRLATGESAFNKRPWSELFTSWSAVQGADPSTVLVTLQWDGVPRSLQLIFNRDIGFITG